MYFGLVLIEGVIVCVRSCRIKHVKLGTSYALLCNKFFES